LGSVQTSALNSDFPSKYNPWVYFLLFCAAHSLLAYSPLGLEAKLFIFLFGLLVPLSVAFTTKLPASSAALHQKEFIEKIPIGFWLVVYGAALLSRIGQLTAWSLWPVSDGSIGAHLSTTLYEKWFWYFFFGEAQCPAVFYWGLAVFYKVFPPSLFSTLLYSVLISAFIAGITYWAVRPFFSKSLSCFCLMASATGFWVLYTGEYCFLHVLALLWQIVCLGFLGRLAQSPSAGESRKNAVFLAFFLGSGFFIAIAWPVVVFMAFLGLGGLLLSKKSAAIILPFTIAFAGWVLLFLGVAAYGHYGRHFQSLLILGSGTDWARQWPDTLSNLTSLFWCNLTGGYGPVWGGMLNPLMAALFFLGLVEFRNIRSSGFLQWVLAGLLISLAPGFLSKSFDVFRLLHSYPFQMIIGGLGFQRLLQFFPQKRAILFLLLFFGISTSLDLYHVKRLAGEVSPTGWNLSKAYGLLERNDAPTGPGFVLTDLMPLTGDQSLDLAVYPFNAAVNSKILPSQAKWVAIVVNGGYVPFLSRRFPDIRWYDLGEDTIWKSDRLLLGVIPFHAEYQSIFSAWRDADLYFRTAVSNYINDRPFVTPQNLVQQLWSAPAEVGSDPFLESCRDEKILCSMPFQDPALLSPIIRRAMEKGYRLPLFSRIKEQLGETKKQEPAKEKAE
jgi:hypothetical protein